jgi:hypothetical protein
MRPHPLSCSSRFEKMGDIPDALVDSNLTDWW